MSAAPLQSQTSGVTAPTSVNSGVGEVLALFRGGRALTRAEVMTLTGLSRTTVNQRLDQLLQARLIAAAGEGSPTRGRPATRFAFHARRGVLLVADLGATGMRAAVCDLNGEIASERQRRIDITGGPDAILTLVEQEFAALLAETGTTPAQVHGIGLSVPGPVDFARGAVVNPPIMTGWDGYDIRGRFARTYDCPVQVDKDVNAMAIGEYRRNYPDAGHLLMLKLGTGIGAGVVVGGQIYRGADGAAGDIGHSQLSQPDDENQPLCRCGNIGCVEAYVGGWALMRDLQAAGRDVSSVDAAIELALSGDPVAVQITRRAGRVLGAAIAGAVSLFNPRVVVIGGQLARVEGQLFAGIREMVYRRSLPLATTRLQIVRSSLDNSAGPIGLALSVADAVFAPEAVERLITDAT
ncbi:ROK family protein [Kineosporia rhizophila]|uniref:ROK family transcriptional regulator n=1 Tax=Kineosporia TaxID=49184 RepID=UPI001E5DB79F|nr:MULTISPECIES: ROK family protein [Kineosporia]MCE0538927.1 ROK family protein [Kineosporia rhizophila]GLY16212.1 sugar kinase [Kineosporia sp. NBRC 101677]